MNSKMFFIYILCSLEDRYYYVGSCQNIEVRLNQHNRMLVKSTKSHVPWELVYKESFLTLAEARKRELQIKSWKKRGAIEKILK
ncbi:MAG: GIY-YIG nuclease family protein [Patescibacteria group bacterium]